MTQQDLTTILVAFLATTPALIGAWLALRRARNGERKDAAEAQKMIGETWASLANRLSTELERCKAELEKCQNARKQL